MSIISKWQLGGKALEVLRWARDLATTVDPMAVLQALNKVVELERSLPRGGCGAEKGTALLQWFVEAFPQYQRQAAVVAGFAKALVALANALGLFQRGSDA